MYRVGSLIALIVITAVLGLGITAAAIHYAGDPHMPWDGSPGTVTP